MGAPGEGRRGPLVAALLTAVVDGLAGFVGSTPAGDRLYRERRATTEGGPDGVAPDPAGDAVRELLAGRPQDPDHRSDWPPGVTLRGPVTIADGVLTVDLALPGPLPGP